MYSIYTYLYNFYIDEVENISASDDVRTTLLLKMYTHRYIGGQHTDVVNLRKGFHPKQYGEVDDAIKQLIKDGWLIPKPAKYGFHVSLNPRIIKEVEEIISKP